MNSNVKLACTFLVLIEDMVSELSTHTGRRMGNQVIYNCRVLQLKLYVPVALQIKPMFLNSHVRFERPFGRGKTPVFILIYSVGLKKSVAALGVVRSHVDSVANI